MWQSNAPFDCHFLSTSYFKTQLLQGKCYALGRGNHREILDNFLNRLI